MYIIPIFTRTIKNIDTVKVSQVWMFLERNGSHCIPGSSLEDALVFASLNSIPLAGAPIVSDHFIFLPVDSTADLSSFYLWGEIRFNEQPMKEVWRSFLWISEPNSTEDVWGTNTFLRDIPIADSHSVHTIIERYFKTI